MEIQHDSTWIGIQNRWNWVNHGNPTPFSGAMYFKAKHDPWVMKCIERFCLFCLGEWGRIAWLSFGNRRLESSL